MERSKLYWQKVLPHSVQRRGAAFLDCFEHDDRFDIANSGDADQRLQLDLVLHLDIARGDVEQVIHVAADCVAGDDIGIGEHFALEAADILVVAGIGSSARWYRTIFLEEISKDYVRTARAKGLSELAVLFRHVLRNALIPILTGVVVVIPLLFMGSLLVESFFAIPGLGSYTIDAINAQDFAVVRAMVFIGSVLYIIGLILTDLSYTLVDPRVSLE